MVDRTYWRLSDMQAAISEIKNLLDGKDVGILISDRPTRAAFERFLEILSEASRHVPDEWKKEFSNTQWRQVGDLGNFIRRAYHKIDLDVLWSIYENDLHPLELVIEQLILRCDPPKSED